MTVTPDRLLSAWPAWLILLYLVAADSHAWNTVNRDLTLDCEKQHLSIMLCSYRLLEAEPPVLISARHNDMDLEINNHQHYPWMNAVSAILFLVDTSDPGRQPVIEKNRIQIKKILSHIQPHHRVGLASFDDRLRLEAPIGSNPDDIIQALERLSATGRTTELYRNVIQAVDLLSTIDADRKVIYLFSDGLAEDRAYFHQDVVQSSSVNSVVINTIGFPRSVTLSVGLQTLRRLSEETGGIYVEADMEHRLPETFTSQPFGNIERGGRFNIDLSALSDLNGPQAELLLMFSSEPGLIDVRVPVSVNILSSPSLGESPPVTTPSLAISPPPDIRIITTPGSNSHSLLDSSLWYGVPVALLVLIILTILTLYLISHRQEPPASPLAGNPYQVRPYAYLICQDENKTRFPITRGTWRIGRSRDNEMTLDDNSVSRRHAELKRQDDGRFNIRDLDSLNGIYINSEPVKYRVLEEGDIIEIGDYYLRFTQHPLDYHLAEDTVMIRTRTPLSRRQ